MNTEQIELLKNSLNINITKLFEERMTTFGQLFKIYNSHTNLISKKDAEHLFSKHIYDSLALNLFFEKYKIKETASLMDIGTGGGFPAIPLSIAFPEMEIYPIDSIAKKIGFIELVQKELRLNNLHPLCKRVEELDSKMKSTFDIVTSRAVAPLRTLLEYAVPYLKIGGFFAAYKSINADNELLEAQNALKVLNAELAARISYKLPQDCEAEEYSRELLIIKKTTKTPFIYPRKSGQAKKNPL